MVDPAEVAANTYTIQGGNDRLPHALAETAELHGRIAYGEEINRIEDTGTQIRVATASGKTW